MENCIFCNIVAGEVPAEKVYEDDTTLAFLDIMPRASGHTMIIPKAHVRNFLELPEELIGPFFEASQKVAKMILKALLPAGFTLGMNNGKVSGQEVDHLHFHIIPRWHGDGGGPIQSVVSNKPKEDLKVIAKKIRAVQ